MSNLVFRITKEKDNDYTYGNADVVLLCGLIGADIIDTELRWGSCDVKMHGLEFRISKQRRINEIRIRLQDYYSSEIKVRDLTGKQVVNLKAKIKKLCEDHGISKDRIENRNSFASGLSDLGFKLYSGDHFIFEGFNFYLSSDKTFYSSQQIRMNHGYFSISDTEISVRSQFENFMKEFKETRIRYESALEKVNSHGDLIRGYYEAL